MAHATLHNLAQQQQQQQLWQALLSASTNSVAVTAAAAGPAALANLEQLLLAQGATASFLQAAALASSIAVADQVSQNAANAANLNPPTNPFASLPGSDEDVGLEHVSSYTVQEPSSESLSSSSGSQTAMDEEQLEFLCEFLSDASSDGAGMRAASPPVQVAWSDVQQQSPSWSGVALSPPSPTSASLLASPRSDLSATDLSLELFLSSFDDMSPAAAVASSSVQSPLTHQLQHMRFSPSSSPSPPPPSLPARSLDHAASIDDILAAQSIPLLQPIATATAAATSERSTDAAPPAAIAGRAAHLAPRPAPRGTKRSPRLSGARRTLSAPSYKVTLPDSGASSDDTDPSNSSNSDGGRGKAHDVADVAGDDVVKRRRGSRSKKRRAASDTTPTTTGSSGAATTATTSGAAPPDSFRYRRRRDQNNEAVRRCRQRNKDKYEESVRRSAILQAENSALKQRLTSMERDMLSLRQRLSSTSLDAAPLAPAAVTRKFGGGGSGGSSGDDESTSRPVTLWDMFVDMTGEL